MCNFFSCISDGFGKIYYFDSKIRKQVIDGKLESKNIHETDSHSQIASYFKLDVDEVNKYEYDPITKRFVIDQINVLNDAKEVEKQVRNLDFKLIVPNLIIKPIINPLEDRHLLKNPVEQVSKKDLENLKKWIEIRDSVGYSVRDSVRDSVGYSVRDSVGYSVEYSVWDSVRDSVGYSVRDSVWNSVWDSVWNSVWDSVWDFIYAYISSFFDIEYDHDFNCAINLWNRGLVPSYDGKIWRLHAHEDARIVWEGEI